MMGASVGTPPPAHVQRHLAVTLAGTVSRQGASIATWTGTGTRTRTMTGTMSKPEPAFPPGQSDMSAAPSSELWRPHVV